jgi:hypothetical protein
VCFVLFGPAKGEFFEWLRFIVQGENMTYPKFDLFNQRGNFLSPLGQLHFSISVVVDCLLDGIDASQPRRLRRY